MAGNRKRKKKAVVQLSIVIILLLIIWCWTECAEGQAQVKPSYAMVNIMQYCEQNTFLESEYQLLYQQTGLAKAAIVTLQQEGRLQELPVVQKAFFDKHVIQCKANTICSKEERIVYEPETDNGLDWRKRIPCVEDGDILITFNCHVLGWRNGHAALVIDAEQGLTLEARVLGSDSAIMSIKHWLDYPSFAVLRLKKTSREEREEIATYAETFMTEIPYRLTAVARKQEPLSGTQCAHLVWAAYAAFGYNLDSDGGFIVTPNDLYRSILLDTVQVYGMPLR